MLHLNCDNVACHKRFIVKAISTRRLKDGIQYHYFECPACGTEYFVSYSSGKTRAMAKQLDSLRRRLVETTGNPKRYEAALKRIHELEVKHGDEVRKIGVKMHAPE